MTWRLTLLVVCAVVVLVALPACAEKQWDTGEAIEGELEGKWIEIAITVDPDNPVQDTMDCQNPDDTDHSIDPEQSEGQEGTDSDAIADWGSTKCWWWCEGGEVTQNSWTTTWTAPAVAGEWRLECGVEDLPKSIPQSESGCRDDARHYAGTGYAGAAGESFASQAGTGAPPPAASFTATLEKRFNCAVEGPLHFDNWYEGNPLRNELTTPDNSQGFYKKVEFKATIFPRHRAEGKQFTWVQKERGVFDGDHGITEGPYGDWHEDTGTCTTIPRAEYDDSIFLIDSPGLYSYRQGGTSGWDAPTGNRWRQISGLDYADPYRFIDKVKYGNTKISTNYWNVNAQDWTRHLRIYSNADTEYIWEVIVNN